MACTKALNSFKEKVSKLKTKKFCNFHKDLRSFCTVSYKTETYFICLTIVLFPDSPAPANKRRKKRMNETGFNLEQKFQLRRTKSESTFK